ncbi:CAP-Gly domain-containing linker protein 1 homolog [Camellia sinensis]|uniref:CAP-Gly domain-containing linker protein 1 homolog n=1 Tax=Camellia sinensis TaxID=4442 RepID=UPI0010361359|nr:CAP-Gly domain-containing linker protein 1 homolog [Camellia sinensis]
MWKVPIRSVELKLGIVAEGRVRRVKEWREREKAKWDELVQPSALFEAGLGPKPSSGDLDRAELEARRRVQEAEDQAILAKAQQFKESQADRPPKPVAKERIRPRPKPLGEKNLGDFVPRPPPADPLKERSLKEMEALGVGKKKKRVSQSEEVSAQKGRREMSVKKTSAVVGSEGGEGEGAPGRVGGPEVVDIALEVTKVVPERQVEDEAVGPGRRREGQPQGGLVPQEEGVGETTAIYHARVVAGRLEGEEGPARAGADRLVGTVEEAALRSASRFNEAELLRGLYSAQMELKEKSASWESAHIELQTVKAEVEDTRCQVVSLEFQLAGEQKKLDEAQRAYVVAVERHEEAMSNNEELVRQKDEADSRVGDLQRELEGERAKAGEEKGRLQRELEAARVHVAAEKESLKKELEAEKAKAASERAALQKELDEERARAASKRAAYPDLCIAVVEQFKGSVEFQTAVDAVVASSLINEAWAKCL